MEQTEYSRCKISKAQKSNNNKIM